MAEPQPESKSDKRNRTYEVLRRERRNGDLSRSPGVAGFSHCGTMVLFEKRGRVRKALILAEFLVGGWAPQLHCSLIKRPSAHCATTQGGINETFPP